MFLVSFRIADELLTEADHNAGKLHVARGEYIRRALDLMNQVVQEKTRKKRILNASRKVRQASLEICENLEGVEYYPFKN